MKVREINKLIIELNPRKTTERFYFICTYNLDFYYFN